MRLITFTFAVLYFCLAGCVPENQVAVKTAQNSTKNLADTSAKSQSKTKSQTVTVFLSGNTDSQLKPCGCAAGQLGGFSRRQFIFDRVDPQKRVLIDTGNFLKGTSPQDMVKLNTIITSLTALQYDVVNLNENDLNAVSDTYPVDQMPFNIIGPDEKLPDTYIRKIDTDSAEFLLTVASVSNRSIEDGVYDSQKLEKLFANNNSTAVKINILLVDEYKEHIADFLAGSGNLIDVVVCDYDTDSPAVIDTGHKKPLFVSVGKLGKYVGRLDVILSDKNKTTMSYSEIAVDKKLPASEQLDQIYEAYRQMVRMEDLMGKVVKTPLPNGHKYVGSDKCKTCHEYEYKKWSKTPHAHAYQTLVDSGDKYDPECIECHVVGLKHESGFKNENSPKGLRNVGCEVCHGPRSKHIKNPKENAEKANNSEPPASLACITCHTPEHSPGFQVDEEGYRKKNIHTREQK